MTHKIKKRVAVIFLLMSYCVGVLFAPINAEEINGFDALLSEREGSASNVSPVKKKANISDFTDVKQNDWFYRYLEYLVENEIVNGKTETTFEPGSTFSYAECSAVIVRYLGLEKEATQRKKEIDKRCPEMINFWYSGYFEVLAALDIFVDYGVFETDGNKLLSIDKDAANSPISRCRFAESISASFELDGKLSAENVYPEVGGRGREFIVGGDYDSGILEMYKVLIKDFEEIPEESRMYVLKAYYNGIFNGDVSGNFYPHNNLTRGEMAKVLATIMDFSLRTRLVQDGYGKVLGVQDIHTDSVGVETIRYDSWTELLAKESGNLTVSNGKIKFTADSTNAPFGYATDVYLYEVVNGACVKQMEATLHDGNGTFEYNAENAKVLFVLRNIAENSRPEGVLEVSVVDGEIVSSMPKIYEMPQDLQHEKLNMNVKETPTGLGVSYFL